MRAQFTPRLYTGLSGWRSLCAMAKGSQGKPREIEFHLIDIAPAPSLSGLEGLHDGMLGVMEMFRRMFIFRRVAAAHMSALQTKTQVNPCVANFQALFAAIGSARCYGPNLIQMSASRHKSSFTVVPKFKTYVLVKIAMHECNGHGA